MKKILGLDMCPRDFCDHVTISAVFHEHNVTHLINSAFSLTRFLCLAAVVLAPRVFLDSPANSGDNHWRNFILTVKVWGDHNRTIRHGKRRIDLTECNFKAVAVQVVQPISSSRIISKL
ncbi:MAG: hypothetical protein ACRDF4_05595 [Rhabdochlamydiaceae bacterium]